MLQEKGRRAALWSEGTEKVRSSSWWIRVGRGPWGKVWARIRLGGYEGYRPKAGRRVRRAAEVYSQAVKEELPCRAGGELGSGPWDVVLIYLLTEVMISGYFPCSCYWKSLALTQEPQVTRTSPHSLCLSIFTFSFNIYVEIFPSALVPRPCWRASNPSYWHHVCIHVPSVRWWGTWSWNCPCGYSGSPPPFLAEAAAPQWAGSMWEHPLSPRLDTVGSGTSSVLAQVEGPMKNKWTRWIQSLPISEGPCLLQSWWLPRQKLDGSDMSLSSPWKKEMASRVSSGAPDVLGVISGDPTLGMIGCHIYMGRLTFSPFENQPEQ